MSDITKLAKAGTNFNKSIVKTSAQISVVIAMRYGDNLFIVIFLPSYYVSLTQTMHKKLLEGVSGRGDELKDIHGPPYRLAALLSLALFIIVPYAAIVVSTMAVVSFNASVRLSRFSIFSQSQSILLPYLKPLSL